jgi:acylglycerol lipase
MKPIEFEWETRDHLRLYAQSWQPETEPKALVCLIHGLGEHSGRYEHVAARLTGAGYVLAAFDLRGHGKSQGQRGHAPDFQILIEDIGHFLREGAKRYPDLPSFLYGHSLGGNLVLEYALRQRPRLAGLIATGPAFRTAFKPPALKIAIGKIMVRLWPNVSMSNEIDVQTLSRNPDVVRAYVNDPLVHDRLTPRLGIGMLQEGEWLLHHASELSVPLLLMHGAADRLTSPQASSEFAARAGEWCTLKIWEGLYHEIHNETEQEAVLSYLVDWLDERCGYSKTSD